MKLTNACGRRGILDRLLADEFTSTVARSVPRSTHTKAWYADHEDEAKKVAEKCRAEERADYQFAGDARQDCQNAADATYFSVYEPTEPTFSSMGGSR